MNWDEISSLFHRKRWMNTGATCSHVLPWKVVEQFWPMAPPAWDRDGWKETRPWFRMVAYPDWRSKSLLPVLRAHLSQDMNINTYAKDFNALDERWEPIPSSHVGGWFKFQAKTLVPDRSKFEMLALAKLQDLKFTLDEMAIDMPPLNIHHHSSTQETSLVVKREVRVEDRFNTYPVRETRRVHVTVQPETLDLFGYRVREMYVPPQIGAANTSLQFGVDKIAEWILVQLFTDNTAP